MTDHVVATAPRAMVLVTGDELLRGFVQDANTQTIATGLRHVGVDLVSVRIVGDSPEALHEAAISARAVVGADGLVITTGGLGPTHDDRTTEIVARAAGLPRVLDEVALSWVEDRLRSMGRLETAADQAMFADGNRKQATFPSGAVAFPPAGTAPGFAVRAVEEDGSPGTTFVVLPGPPSEMRHAWKQALASSLLTRLIELVPPRAERLVRIWGVPESAAANALTAQGHSDSDAVTVTLCARDGELELSIRGSDAGAVDALTDAMCATFADSVFAVDDERDVVQIVSDVLVARSWTIATAESCTAGMLAARLTDRAGSSVWMRGGAVVYANDIKTSFADVPAETIAEHGAVSEEVARGLAEGIRARCGSDVGVGITGVAGPGGGTVDKPVGLVWIAVALPDGTHVRELRLGGGRANVRVRSCGTVLHLLRQLLSD